MGAGFIRRFTTEQPLDVLLAIEGVVIIDGEPPSNLTGLPTGAVCVVGEFEDGPLETPTELFSGLDFLNTFGGFGFTYGGVPSSNPCARSRNADSAVTPEYWNGNGFVALASKTFSRLFVVRVDTSVGSVNFTPLPCVTGNGNFSWNITPGSTLVVTRASGGAPSTSTATFSAAVAALVSAAGTYPTTFAGGESLNVTIDADTPQQIGPVDIVFAAGDTSQALVIARINGTLGYTAAVGTSSTVITMSGRVAGNAANVRVNSVSTGLVTTATGFSAATATGTGTVANAALVTFGEVKSVIEAAVGSTLVDRDYAGNVRLSLTSGTDLLLASGTAAATLGFTVGQTARIDGTAFLYSTAGTYPTTFAGGETLTLGFDGGVNVTVTFASGDQSQVQVMAKINSYFSRTVVTAATSTILKFAGLANGGQVRVVAATPLVLTKLGLAVGTNTAVQQVATTIPAGTRVRNASAVEWVTTQTTQVPAAGVGPFTILVRPAQDDGTTGAGAPTTVTVLPSAIPGGSFAVNNPSGLTAALTEAALDAAYSAAFDTTLSATAVTRETDLLFAARQSNAVRVAGRANALAASSGLRGRRFVARPPLGTSRALAKSNSQQPGVGAYREERVYYGYPGVSVSLPQIAVRGTDGGAGFTADGIIDAGFDSWICSVCSQIPPEENPGQETVFMAAVLGLERNNPDIQTLTEADYVSFKASGIMAPRMDSGNCIIQSGVTTVDAATHPSLVPSSRGRFSDYCSDTLAAGANAFTKKPMTRARRIECFTQAFNFLNGLKSPLDPDLSRIADFSIDAKTGNPPNAVAAGVFREIVHIQMTPDMLAIVFDMQVGTTVQITQTQ